MSEKFPVKLCREVHDPENPLVFLDVRIGDERGKYNTVLMIHSLVIDYYSPSWTDFDRAACRCGSENGGKFPGSLHRRKRQLGLNRNTAAL